MNNNIIINYDNKIFLVAKEPYETDENSYKRGWFIIKNQEKIKNENELISRSIIYLNENKNNMKY